MPDKLEMQAARGLVWLSVDTFYCTAKARRVAASMFRQRFEMHISKCILFTVTHLVTKPHRATETGTNWLQVSANGMIS